MGLLEIWGAVLVEGGGPEGGGGTRRSAGSLVGGCSDWGEGDPVPVMVQWRWMGFGDDPSECWGAVLEEEGPRRWWWGETAMGSPGVLLNPGREVIQLRWTGFGVTPSSSFSKEVQGEGRGGGIASSPKDIF